jgi:hypothetical protein
LLHGLHSLFKQRCSHYTQSFVVGIAADAFHLTPFFDFHAAALTLGDFFGPPTVAQFFLD